MNSAKNVIQFIVACFLCLFLFSVIFHVQNSKNPYLNNVSILSDILPEKKIKVSESISQPIQELDAKNNLHIPAKLSSAKKFCNFTASNQICDYSLDTNSIVLQSFVTKLLQQSSSTQKRKIRIAYLGDSMIEGDLISQTLRKLLQQKFGGNGVGYVPITSLVSYFRQSLKHSFSPNWIETNFKNKITSAPLFLSGRVYNSKGYNWVEYEDKTISYPIKSSFNKYLITGYKPTNAQILVNKAYAAIPSNKPINKLLVDNSIQPKIKIETSDTQLPFYGVSFESSEGIILDNLSFRGLAGFEYNAIDTGFLKAINETLEYDLIILQFGVNVLNLPTNNQFGWYQKNMINTITRLKYCFPNADFLLIGAADKAFKYKTGYSTAIGMDSLISAQQKIAFDTEIAFYNTYTNMGGFNSIIKWANQNPSLAAKDYTHLSFKGADVLGKSIYDAILLEFNKLNKKIR